MPVKKLLSVRYSAASFNTALFLLRVISGLLMMIHGYGKLVNFAASKDTFMNFLGLGSTVSLSLTVFAEFFCSIFIILGLFTRLACIPIIIAMCVALFSAHNGDFSGKGEMATLFIACFLTILLVGPGRASIDGMIGK